jgi:DNA-binding Xre family transcriptional regulator
LTNYKAKKSNLNKLMQQNNSSLEALEEKTNIPMDQLDQYTNKKIMNLSNAMTISKELNCQIEDLYEWKTEE